MTRSELYKELKQYFRIDELVCPHIYKKFKERSWDFFRQEYLECLLVIRRDILKAPMVCNTATMHERGACCNQCNRVKNAKGITLSAHLLFCAGDFTIQGMTAEQARNRIRISEAMLPHPIRMESGVSWLHVDTNYYAQSGKITMFKG